MHEWKERALKIGEADRIMVYVMEPNDLAVSKAGRFIGHDQEDIKKLAEAGLLDPDIFESRAKEAMLYFIGAQETFI